MFPSSFSHLLYFSYSFSLAYAFSVSFSFSVSFFFSFFHLLLSPYRLSCCFAISLASVDGIRVGRGRETAVVTADDVITPPPDAEVVADVARADWSTADEEEATPRLVEGNFQVLASFE